MTAFAIAIAIAVPLALLLVNVLLFRALKSGIPQRSLANPVVTQDNEVRTRD